MCQTVSLKWGGLVVIFLPTWGGLVYVVCHKLRFSLKWGGLVYVVCSTKLQFSLWGRLIYWCAFILVQDGEDVCMWCASELLILAQMGGLVYVVCH